MKLIMIVCMLMTGCLRPDTRPCIRTMMTTQYVGKTVMTNTICSKRVIDRIEE